MAQENIEITLPFSKLKAVIRPYVRRKDQRRVDQAVFGDEMMDISLQPKPKSEEKNIMDAANGAKIRLSNTLDVTDVEIVTMLIKLGDKDDPTKEDVDELHKDDYDALLKIIDPMFESEKRSKKS